MTSFNHYADWTFGAEHELADWHQSTPLPDGFGIDSRDVTMVNSNGIAVDPRGVLWDRGGEINTPPTDRLEGQVDHLNTITRLLPQARVNYRSNLHIHVRVPGLGQSLELLKRVQRCIHDYMPRALAQIEPLPRPQADQCGTEEEYKGALRRWRRRRVSHQTLLTEQRFLRQLASKSVDEFYTKEPPSCKKTGRPLWHLQPRLCVNLRQHLETDTVEFRHFPGTLDPDKLRICLMWCQDFLWAALNGQRIQSLLSLPYYQTEKFPAFPPYIHWMEERYRATCHDGTLTREEIARNIQRILEEDAI